MQKVVITVERGISDILECSDDVDAETRCYDLDEFNGEESDC
jgi:hypothetical protein